MRFLTAWLKPAGFALAFVLLTIPARANIIIDLVSVTPSGSGNVWTYDAQLVAGSQLQPSPSNCSNGPVGSICDGLITIYDFDGYVPDSHFEPDGWVFSAQNLGITPLGVTPGSNIAGVDNPTLLNLSWLYDPGLGTPNLNAMGSNVDLGLFGASSIYTMHVPSEYSTRSNTLSIPNGRSVTLDVTLVPQVPEPASMFLVGSGLFAMALGLKRRQRKSRVG